MRFDGKAFGGFLLAGILHAGTVLNPMEFGAKADGRTNDTKPLQSAIDRCASRGGGTVRVPAGTYLIGPITLKSRITLELAKGAVLLGTEDPTAYPVTGETIWQGVPAKRPLALIGATGQSDLRIAGEGVVDGSGAPWWKLAEERKRARQEELPRPYLVQFTRCRRVVVEGITLRNAPFYALVPYFSSDVTVRNIRILSPPDAPNTDGVAPYSSHHVRIQHSTIDVGDDNVAIKSSRPSREGEDSSASDITVSDCTFVHGHGATIGADTGGGVHDVVMENLRLEGTTYGLRIKSGRGMAGEVYNIVYRNIVMRAANPAITISEYYPDIPKQDTAQKMTPSTPRFHDITLSHVKASGGEALGLVIGLPESPVQNLVLDGVELSSDGKGLEVRNATVILRHSDLRARSGPALIEGENVRIEKHQ